MKVTRINHAAINVHGKWPEVEEFYTKFMGIETTPRPGAIDGAIGGCWLQFPNGQVHVIDAELDGSAGNPMGPHVSYYVEDLAGAINEIEERGLEMRKFDIPDVGAIAWVTDPAGNTVEIQQDPDCA